MSYQIDTEENLLVHQCLSGNKAAQRRLYLRYVQAMYHTAVRMTGNRMDAEDIVQDSFIRVFENLASFKAEAALGAWIKRITINTALSFLRRNNRMTFIDEEPAGMISGTAETAPERPADQLKQIHQAIKELPEGCRVVFTLFLLEGYRHKEIAGILNISESTSKSQYLRAKRLLQKKLKRQVENQ